VAGYGSRTVTGNLLVLMPMPLGLNIDMKGQQLLDGMCKNYEHTRLLRVFPCLWVSRCCYITMCFSVNCGRLYLCMMLPVLRSSGDMATTKLVIGMILVCGWIVLYLFYSIGYVNESLYLRFFSSVGPPGS
jgi:hypothetical protein